MTRQFLTLAVALLVTPALFAQAGGKKPAPRKPGSPPNIVIILADDLGYADVGYHGCKDIPTPNIDKLAKNGVRFSSGYVSGPYCSPTRAGMLTGKYQTRFGHEFNAGAKGTGLPLGEVTLAQRLAALGYVTGLVGKWHLGSETGMHPNERGFHDFYGFLGGAHTYFPAMGGNILRGKKKVNEQEYLTDALARESVAFIDNHAAKPFFLFLSFNAVHTPMHATDQYLARFPDIKDKKRQTYAAMLSAMDDAIGDVMASLQENGLEEDTLIFFLSDNGGPTMPGTTINAARNDPLRGSKRQLLEGGVRVPFVMVWKGKLPAGKSYDEPVIALDIYPTSVAAAGGKVKDDWKLDGVNLMPFLNGKSAGPPHQTLYWRFGEQLALRQGDWKLVQYDKTGLHLYNLKDDIGEKNNLAGKNPEKLKELKTRWDQWNTGNVKPLWGGGPKVKLMSADWLQEYFREARPVFLLDQISAK